MMSEWRQNTLPQTIKRIVHDQLSNGGRFRILNLIDDGTKKCRAGVADTSISGRRVARERDVIIARRGKPDLNAIRVAAERREISGRLQQSSGEFASAVPTPRASHAAISKHEDAAKIQLNSRLGPQPIQSSASSRHSPGLQTQTSLRVARTRGLPLDQVALSRAQRTRCYSDVASARALRVATWRCRRDRVEIIVEVANQGFFDQGPLE